MATIDTAGGARLHVREVGGDRSRPIVLVHGWSLSHRAFRPQLEALSPEFRVIAPDLRGHGESSPGEGCSLEDFVRDLVAVFEAAALREAVLAGWSWGAEVALAAYPALRDRVSALALISATPRFTSGPDWPHGLTESRVRALRARLARAPEETRRAFVEGMFVDGELPSAERERAVREQLEMPPDVAAARATLDALASTDLRDRLDALRGVPVLLVHGDRDPICAPAASAWLHDRLPGSRLEILAGAGHAPQLTRAAEVGALVAALARGAR